MPDLSGIRKAMNITLPPKPFYMIRHGETVANAAELLAGSTDSPLTDKGRAQARNAQKLVSLLELKPTTIVHSNLSRARDTAAIINESLNLPMFEDSRYAEMCAGDWEGKTYAECKKVFLEWVEAPNGETTETFFGRIHATKYDALNAYDAPVLFVGHGGIFRAFFKLYDLDVKPVENCTVYGFTPRPANDDHPFPWHTTHYTLCDQGKLQHSEIEV